MDMFEEARALDGTMRLCGITQEELAGKLGVSQSYIANKLRLLRYSPARMKEILAGGLSERHARAILRLSDDASRRLAIGRAVNEHLSVAQTEALVDVLFLTETSFDKQKITDTVAARVSTFITDAVATLTSAGVRARRVCEEDGKETRIMLILPK